MESHKPKPKGTLGHFLFNLLNSQEIKGLEWICREEKLFKIPWADKRNQVHAHEEQALFKKWEIYKQRYKMGDPENEAGWKQTFRGALNKSPYVEAIPEKYQLKISNPYRVYRLSSEVIYNPDSPIVRKKRKRNSCPKDAEKTAEMQLSQQYMFDSPPNNSPFPDVALLTNGNFGNVPNCLSDVENVLDQTSPSNSSQIQSDVTDAEMTNLKFNNSPNNCSTTSSPYGDYRCEEFQQNLPQTGPFANSRIPQCAPQMCGPITNPTSHVKPMDTIDTPFVKFQVFYLNKLVQEGNISHKGVHLIFDSESNIRVPMEQQIDQQLCEQIKCPKCFNQLALPSVKQCFHLMDRCDLELLPDVQDVLDNMKRGLLLFCEDRTLFAFRLCTTRVFASYSNKGRNLVIDRKLKERQQLFEMDIFENDLKKYRSDSRNNPYPPSKVILTFGEEFNLGKKHLISVELTVLEAENMLKREMPNGRDIQLSDFDSLDYLLASRVNQSLSINSFTGFDGMEQMC